MEKKNTILLTVIAVATLLVAVVGATFAYFTATASTSGDGDSTGTVNTATVANIGLTSAAAGHSDDMIYPGTMNYAAMSVVPTKTGTDDAEYTLTYTVSGNVTLSEAFEAGSVYYTVYRTTTAAATPVSCEDVVAAPGATGTQYSQSCTISTDLTDSGEIVQARTAVTGTTADINITGETLTTNSGTTYYYYLVVEYPNTSSDQNADQQKTITASLTGVDITNTAQVGA